LSDPILTEQDINSSHCEVRPQPPRYIITEPSVGYRFVGKRGL